MPRGVYPRQPRLKRWVHRPLPPVVNPDGTVSVPCGRRDGTIRAYTVVDAVDAEWVSQQRWHMTRGYAARFIIVNGHRTRLYLHRAVLGLVRGDGLEGDHINHDKLDNRRANLRSVPHVGNIQNTSGRAGSTSRFRGVYWERRKKRWRAYVRLNGKNISLGSYVSEGDAGEAARLGRLKYLPYAVD